MYRFHRALLSTVLFSCAGMTYAAPVGLGVAGEFNLVSLGNFNMPSGNIQGAVAVAGNFKAANFSINTGNSAYAGDAVVVGGNLTLQGGSISNGNAYVGGQTTVSNFGFGGQLIGGSSPVAFSEQAAQLRQLSIALSGLTPTGNTAIQWGGMAFTGSGGPVDIFNLSSSDLSSVNWGSTAGLGNNGTVILNIGGTVASLQGGLPDIFANYNVLYNFYEATSLDFNNVGVFGSVLAPLATVNGGSGQIDGNVIVEEWNSSVSLGNTRAFNTTDVAQYAGRPAQPAVNEPSAVPEPSSIALFLLAMSMLGWVSVRGQRRQRACDAPNLNTASPPVVSA